MRTWTRVSLAALLTLSVASLAVAAPRDRGPDAQRRATTTPTTLHASGYRLETAEPKVELERRQAMLNWLLSDMVRGALDSPVDVPLTKADRFALVNPDPNDRPFRVGVVKPVGLSVDLTGLAPGEKPGTADLATGVARFEDDGSLTWSLAITSEGATALRVHFTKLDLPPQARLFVHDLQGSAYGPYVSAGPHGDGDLWSPNVFGELAVVQLRVDGPLTDDVIDRLHFVIEDVGHSGDRFRLGRAQLPQKVHCNGNRECIENAECPPPSPFGALGDVQDAIAHYQFVSGPFLYICSGGLLADTSASGTPYFLTARHCVSKARDARSMQTFFQFTAPCGTNNCPGPGTYDTNGATLLSSNSTSDYSFLRLDEAAPSGSFFLGWDATTDVAGSNGYGLHRVSHPSGAPQAYSTHSVDTSAPTCQSWPRGPWIYSRDTYGATEGGSSGSPVTDAAGLVVGQLSGGCGFNVGDECDSVSNATVDGAFANYYSSISQWLDPADCTPSTEVCDDGTDNDCDGAVDCDDSDCSGATNCDGGTGGCGSGSNRDPCETDADCSSCNCRGGSCRGN